MKKALFVLAVLAGIATVSYFDISIEVKPSVVHAHGGGGGGR